MAYNSFPSRNLVLWLLFSGILLSGCTEKNLMDDSLLTDPVSGFDQKLDELRQFKDFPVVYYDPEEFKGKAFEVYDAETSAQIDKDLRGTQSASNPGTQIVEQRWYETEIQIPPNGWNNITRIYASYVGTEKWTRPDNRHKHFQTTAYQEWYGPNFYPMVGAGADFHNGIVYNMWLSGSLMYADGTLGGNVIFTTAKPGDSSPEVFFETSAQTFPRRVVIGLGYKLSGGKFVTQWTYTAPYDPVSRRLAVTVPTDIWIYIPTHKNGSSASDTPQMIVRSWDYCDEWQQFVRTYVTGVSMTTRGDGKGLERFGLQFTTIN